MNKQKKLFIALLSLTLILVIVVTGFGYPGFFIGSSSSGSGNSSDEEITGNSKAIHIQPLDYLKIDADENAFEHDVDVDFSEITDDAELDALQDTLRSEAEGYNEFVIAAYDIDMGMGADDVMPGSYTVSIDLEKAGVPEDIWPSVTAYRVDGDGYWSEYATGFDGNSLIVESKQNSTLVIVGSVLYGGYLVIDELTPTIAAMSGSLKRFFTSEDSIYVYENDDWRTGKRIFKLKFTYGDTVEQLKKRRKEIKDGISGDIGMKDTRKALGEKLGVDPDSLRSAQLRPYRETLVEEKCRENAEYASLDDQIKQYEDTGRLRIEMIGRIAKNLRIAYKYIKEQVKVNMPKYVMDVRLSYITGGDGATGLTVNHILFKNSYIMINTSYLVNNGSEAWYDKMLVTATHELYHACQRTYCSRLYNIKFEEATAQMIEDDCNEYYLNNGVITHSGSSGNGTRIEYYALPIDKFSVTYDGETQKYSGSSKSDVGYPLCHFIRYLRDKLSPDMSYEQMCKVYKKFWTTPNVTEILKELFNLNDEGLTMRYQMFARANQAMFYNEANRLTEDMDFSKRWAFPMSFKYDDDTDPLPRFRVEVTDHAYTIRTRYLSPAIPNDYEGDVALLLAPDPGFEETLSDLQLIPVGPYYDKAKRSKNGLFMPPQRAWEPFYVMEVDGGLSDTGNSASYTVWALTAPEMDAPATDGTQLKFTLPEMSGIAGAGQGLIDGYRVTITCSDGTKMEKFYPIKDSGKAQALKISDLKNKKSKAEDVTFSVTVCEYIDEGDGKYSFGPESAAAQSGAVEPVSSDDINWFNGTWIKQGDKPGAGTTAYFIEILNDTTLRFGAVDSATGVPFLPDGKDETYAMRTVERTFTYDAKTKTIMCDDYPTANSHGGGYPPIKLTAYPGTSAEDDRLGLTWNPKDNSSQEGIYVRNGIPAKYWKGRYKGNFPEHSVEYGYDTLGEGQWFNIDVDKDGKMSFNLITEEGRIVLDYDPVTQTASGQSADGRYSAKCTFSEVNGIKHLHMETVRPDSTGVFDGDCEQ